jgi:CubicO group peptidase (beta-lactamase class C family)
MSSGLKYKAHSFLPWDDEPHVYCSLNLRWLAQSAKPFEPPGTRFHYNNYNLILLGMILERVTSSTVSVYLQEKVWKPLGYGVPRHFGISTVREAAWRKWKAG